MINIVNLNNISDIESWLKSNNNVYVGRAKKSIEGSKWGNPHKLENEGERQKVINQYRSHITTNQHLASTVHELKGKVLGCWCAPKLCHAAVLHELAGNNPIYQPNIQEDLPAMTRNSNSSEKPPISPKPVSVKPVKLTTAQLQEKVEQLERQMLNLLEDSKEKDRRLKKMEEQIIQLEADELRNASYLSVQRNVSTLLSNRVAQLEQYTRRYSVIVSGIERKAGENKDSLRTEIDSLIQEAGSTTKISDVDKFHRNGPRQGVQQDIIVRFKSHEAKEAFYKKRKSISSRQVWVKPSLSSYNSNLLKEAKELIKPLTSNASTYDNPPEFVFANIHGDLQVKLARETNEGSMFYSFNTIQKLYEILNKADKQTAFHVSDKDLRRFDDPKGSFPRTSAEMAEMDSRRADAAALNRAEEVQSNLELSIAEIVASPLASASGIASSQTE